MLSDTRSYAGLIDLDHALRAGWVEFWYQPKIDLKKKQVVGVEMLARARHPFHGVLPAARFLQGADEATLQQLAMSAIKVAMHTSRTLWRERISLPVTVNAPASALLALPTELILDAQPQGEDWPGLIFDVLEDDILHDMNALTRIVEELSACGMKLAADGFGRSLSSLIVASNAAGQKQQVEKLSRRILELKNVLVYELKLDRNLVAGCAGDVNRSAMCKVIIDLIHHIGSSAVAVGIETPADYAALRDMGCDVGQGHYFSQPLPFDDFMSLMRSRTKNHKFSVTGAVRPAGNGTHFVRTL